MLFVPFVENSFKHGLIHNGILNIEITLQTNPDSILFKIKNSASNTQNYSEGIGLENIQKRLELVYPEQYDLKIESDESQFKVALFINLKTHLNGK